VDLEALAFASVAAVVYAAVSLRVGDRFPFSRYSMYAKLRDRREGAVLYVTADGRDTGIHTLDAFHGIDPDHVTFDGYPCSQQWVVVEAQSWVRRHVSATAPADAVPVEIGFRILRVEGTVLHERRAVLARGTARRR
jgi:hypothetical protein